jgi:hypothetical protein
MPFNDIFTTEDIKEHLSDYKKVSDFDKIKKGTHIKYFIEVTEGKYKGKVNYHNGGYLRNKFKTYIVLFNKKDTWSVQKKDRIFFYKPKLETSHYEDHIKKNNKLIKELGGRRINMKAEQNDNQDIFSNLRKKKDHTPKLIKIVRDEYNLKGWKYTKANKIEPSNDIVYISLDGKEISEMVYVEHVNYTETDTIKNIKVVNDNGDRKFKWYIKPHKYFIFVHPNTMIKALNRELSKRHKF